MLQGEHSAILLTFIKLPFVIKIFILSVFEWPFYTGFTALYNNIPFSSLPLNHSRRVVVSYKRKYVHEVLAYYLFKLAQKKSVIR